MINICHRKLNSRLLACVEVFSCIVTDIVNLFLVGTQQME